MPTRFPVMFEWPDLMCAQPLLVMSFLRLTVTRVGGGSFQPGICAMEIG